jgi:outer membrane protein TolC
LDAETEASKLDARAARRRAWPELTLGVGMRELDEIGFSDRDTLLSVGLEIPLFDRGARAARAASASADRYTAERALLAARLEADFDALRQELVSRRQSAAMLRTAIESESLTDVAEQAYDAGELGVLELIDAHRTEVALRRQALQRALEARRTYIELQRMKEGP